MDRLSELEALEREYRRCNFFPMRTIRPMWKPSIQARSLDTFDYSTGGLRPLPSIDIGWNQESKIGSLDNVLHVPGGGQNYIFHEDLNWKANSKVGSLDNIDFTLRKTNYLPKHMSVLPPIGTVYYGAKAQRMYDDIVDIHYELAKPHPLISPRKYDHVKAKIGSLKNINHTPRGGDLKIHDLAPVWKSGAKVGSMENADHIAGGGNVNIIDEKPEWNSQSKVGSMDNAGYVPKDSSFKMQLKDINWTQKSKIGSLDNWSHTAGGGDVTIVDKKPRWKAKSKVGALKAAREYDRASPIDFHRHDTRTPLFLL